MEVLFDSQTFMRQRRGGISRLFSQLIAEFDADPSLGVAARLPFRWSNNTHLTQYLSHRSFRSSPAWVPRHALYAAHLLRTRQYESPVDLVHHTYYAPSFLSKPRKTPQAVTVYDMIPELFAGTPDSTGSHLHKRDYVATCDLVICISESTRHDMESVYGDLARRIETIPLSVDARFGPTHGRLAGWPADYLLYVGKRQGYKDFSLLAPAVAALKDAGLEVQVVAVGPSFSRQEREHLERWGVQDLFRTAQLNDRELAQAYANATVLTQTSRYEGFGLTPLEAMASGTAVVIANASSMPEVGGDAASYFTPGDPDDLAESVAALLLDGDLRASHEERGLERACLFTPDAMAWRTARAYRSTIAEV